MSRLLTITVVVEHSSEGLTEHSLKEFVMDIIRKNVKEVIIRAKNEIGLRADMMQVTVTEEEKEAGKPSLRDVFKGMGHILKKDESIDDHFESDNLGDIEITKN